jgi:hypothetical protein
MPEELVALKPIQADEDVVSELYKKKKQQPNELALNA